MPDIILSVFSSREINNSFGYQDLVGLSIHGVPASRGTVVTHNLMDWDVDDSFILTVYDFLGGRCLSLFGQLVKTVTIIVR